MIKSDSTPNILSLFELAIFNFYLNNRLSQKNTWMII